MKRWSSILIGACAFVAVEVILNYMQYIHIPDALHPYLMAPFAMLWTALMIIFWIIAFPAHFAHDTLSTFLHLPLLVKPTFADMGMGAVSLLLVLDAIEGAFVGWFVYEVKRQRSQTL